MTNYDIYKKYKHGESLKGIPAKRVFRSLKENYLQVVLVKNRKNEEVVYNFVPETNQFYRVSE